MISIVIKVNNFSPEIIPHQKEYGSLFIFEPHPSGCVLSKWDLVCKKYFN